MKRLLACCLALAATWLLYEAAVEVFTMWYSGTESEVPVRTWVALDLQCVVNVGAIVLAWRVVRNPGVRSAST